MPLQAGDNRVFPDIQHAENTGGPALFRQQGKAVFDGFSGVPVPAGLAVQDDDAFLPGADTENALQGLGTTGAVQTGQTQNLTPAGHEGHILQLVIHTGKAFYLQVHLAGLIGLGGELIGELTAYHQFDNLGHLQLGGRPGGDPGAVPHDGDFVGNPLDFRHLVGDVDDAHAPVPEHIDNLEQVLHFLFRQGGGGLVKDDDFGVIGNRLGNFHHLPLRNGHGAHNPSGIHIDVQLIKNCLGVFIHLLFVYSHTQGLGIPTQPDVVHNRALQCLVQLLVNHGYPVVQGFLTAFEIDFLAFQVNMTLILVVNAEEALHQGGFSCTVFTHEGVYGACLYLQRNMVQSFYAWESLCNVYHSQ